MNLESRLQAAQQLLAPYAVPIAGQLGTEGPDVPDDVRFPFERDCARVIHSEAYRRLQGKTQVFIAGTGDHYRTRLTHTNEVAQISRNIARALRLNEDLAECVALAHDLGHPPFGHSGEEALDAWLQQFGERFEHNQQSLRVVTLLETPRADRNGLNLQRETLEGMQKHRTPFDQPGALPRGLSLEAQVVNLADEIAYCCHDPEDGLREELFAQEELLATPLGKSIHKGVATGKSVRSALIHLLVNDLLRTTEQTISQKNITSLNDVYTSKDSLVHFSSEIRTALNAHREFLMQRMYLNPVVLSRSAEGQQIIQSLCERYMSVPPEKVTALQKRVNCPMHIAVKDYVAGMTDGYAAKMLAA